MFVEILLFLVLIYLLFIKSKKNLHMLQQNLYNENNRYVKWFIHQKNSFANLEFFCILFMVLANSFFVNYRAIALFVNIAAFVCYLFYILQWKKRVTEEQVKHPLAVTARIKRLIVTLGIFYLVPMVLFIIYRDQLILRSFLLFLLSVLIYFNSLVVLIANFVNKYTVEKFVYHHFRRKAIKKLQSMNHLKVIGITGSYGKTSSKNILADILNSKYVTLPTPRNLNTPYGLIMTINNYLDKFNDVFIAEMGAYTKGEIQQLCELVHPKYGILTRIGTAHLETFGSEEIIQQTKFELIESLPKDGVGVLNKDDPKQTSYHLQNTCKILWIGIDDQEVDVHASDIRCSNKGTTFTVTFRGDQKKYTFETKLLGVHNVYNILAALALGREFAIDISKLQQAVRQVRPVEHRLELKRLGTFYQIDDAYNSNPIGAKNALEVLNMMPGVKVVVTPGMIELGAKEASLNEVFGEQIAQLSGADYVVLIGEKKTEPIKRGLQNEGYPMDRVIVYNNVVDAYTFIRTIKSKRDVYALFENDLPDVYNEK